jgi:hypothetical protein
MADPARGEIVDIPAARAYIVSSYRAREAFESAHETVEATAGGAAAALMSLGGRHQLTQRKAKS